MPYNSKLYWGEQPRWEDIFFDWDFIYTPALESLNAFIHHWEKNKFPHAVFSLYGKAYVGKSTILKRLGVELLNKGYEVFYFNGQEFQYSLFLDLIRNIAKGRITEIALVIDNASYFYYPIRDFISKVPPEINLIVITADRSIKHKKHRTIFIENYFKEFEIDSKLSVGYAEEIVNKLEEKGLLGELRKYEAENEKIRAILKHQELISTLWSIMRGEELKKRLEYDIFHFLHENNSVAKELLTELVIFDELDLEFYPIELVVEQYKKEKDKALNDLQDFIKINERGDIALRMNILNKKILENISRQEISKKIEEILVAITAFVNPNSHSYWNAIDASCTKARLLVDRLNLTMNNIMSILNNIKNYRNDNYNYWLQLGLAERRMNQYDIAINHMLQAKALKENSYMVKHALGTSLMMKAVQDKTINNLESARPILINGTEILNELITNTKDFEVKTFTIHSYITHSIKFYTKFNIMPSNGEISRMVTYSELLKAKDPRGTFTKDIRRKLLSYLTIIHKTNLMKIEIYELNDLEKTSQIIEKEIEELEEIF